MNLNIAAPSPNSQKSFWLSALLAAPQLASSKTWIFSLQLTKPRKPRNQRHLNMPPRDQISASMHQRASLQAQIPIQNQHRRELNTMGSFSLNLKLSLTPNPILSLLMVWSGGGGGGGFYCLIGSGGGAVAVLGLFSKEFNKKHKLYKILNKR